MMRPLLLATALCVTALPAVGAPPSTPGTATDKPQGAVSPGRRGKPAEFQPVEMTEEEAAAQALKARQKNRPIGWKDTDAPPERPIPWMFIAFSGLALLVALPFALRAYNQTRRTIAEVEGASTGAVPRRKPTSKREST